MHVKLYEDISQHGHIATAYAYPVNVEGHYVMDPSPIPKFDNPKMSDCAAIQLFGAGREQRIYAIPPYCHVKSLDFEDYPFDRLRAPGACALCGADDSYLDEVIMDDEGTRMYVCSDTDFCSTRRERGHVGDQSGLFDSEEGVMRNPFVQCFWPAKATVRSLAVDVSFDLHPGEIMGIVGSPVPANPPC